jgi:hypothetical protein
VVGKVHHAGLAEKLWGTDDKGQTWEYVYFLTDMRRHRQAQRLVARQATVCWRSRENVEI